MSGVTGDNPYRASGVIAAAAAGGGVSWQSVETGTTFTAVAGNGYPVDTSSNACTVTLPASASVGDEIIFTDYARNWGTNALTINQNSLKYQGNSTPNPVYDTAGESVHIVYMDVTNGWIPIFDGAVALETPQKLQTYTVDYLVIAGGGGGGQSFGGGGGGAGGYRNSFGSEASGGGSASQTSLTFNDGTVYTMTVGGGGAGGATGTDGDASSLTGSDISDVTTVGGGGGGAGGGDVGRVGGSGGGSGRDQGTTAGAAGTANEGYAGGAAGGNTAASAGGGGGAGAVGYAGQNPDGVGDPYTTGQTAAQGGVGLESSITGTALFRGGGAGGAYESSDGVGHQPEGGNGGGGVGATSNTANDATAGTANTGGGGGAGKNTIAGMVGGTGVVIIRMPDDGYMGNTYTGSPVITTDVGGTGETVFIFNGSGSFTG